MAASYCIIRFSLRSQARSPSSIREQLPTFYHLLSISSPILSRRRGLRQCQTQERVPNPLSIGRSRFRVDGGSLSQIICQHPECSPFTMREDKSRMPVSCLPVSSRANKWNAVSHTAMDVTTGISYQPTNPLPVRLSPNLDICIKDENRQS